MKCDKTWMLLYAVTDRTWTQKQSLYEQVEAALRGGATCIQLREKEMSDEAFLEEALAIKSLCQKYQVPFIINDNLKVALACQADGIHVGQQDMEALNVRKLIGEKMLLGVSAQTLEQAICAEKQGADYLGVGAVFQTTTKADADYVARDTLKAICSTVKIPVVAIGGIYKHNIMELEASGVDGVALVSAIFSAENIEEECKSLRSLSEKMVADEG